MATQPEKHTKKKAKDIIDRVCKARGLKYRIDWNAGSGFMSTLDAVGVIAGHPFVCEAKRIDGKASPLTARQEMHVADFRAAGAFVHVLEDPTSLCYLEYWLETLEPREPHDP